MECDSALLNQSSGGVLGNRRALVHRGCSAGWKTRRTGLGWIGVGGWIAGSALLNQRCARGAGGGWDSTNWKFVATEWIEDC